MFMDLDVQGAFMKICCYYGLDKLWYDLYVYINTSYNYMNAQKESNLVFLLFLLLLCVSTQSLLPLQLVAVIIVYEQLAR